MPKVFIYSNSTSYSQFKNKSLFTKNRNSVHFQQLFLLYFFLTEYIYYFVQELVYFTLIAHYICRLYNQMNYRLTHTLLMTFSPYHKNISHTTGTWKQVVYSSWRPYLLGSQQLAVNVLIYNELYFITIAINLL